MFFYRYAAALLPVAITLLTAFIAVPAETFAATDALQLGILGASSIGIYFLPLIEGKWKSILKTGLAIVAAVLTALIPFITQGFLTPTQIAVVVLAAFTALASEIGSKVRIDSTKARHAAADGSYTITEVGTARSI